MARPRGERRSIESMLASVDPSIPLTGRADGVTYRPMYIRCGKPECWCVGVDLEVTGHGAYWYACWRDREKGQTRYIGKTFREIERPSVPRHRLG